MIAPPIKEVLSKFRRRWSPDWDGIEAALTDREDDIADMLRVAGAQFGMYPEIVAKVLTDIGVGTQPTEEGRLLIDAQFVARMNWIQEQYNQQNPPEGIN